MTISQKEKLIFPNVEIQPEELCEEFTPTLFFEEKIKELEQKIALMYRNPKSNTYEIAMVKMDLDSYKEKFKKFLEKKDENYYKKYKETIKETENKAKNGNNKALCRLIIWDKYWIFKDWIMEKIIVAESVGNRDFLSQIGDSIKMIDKKTPHSNLKVFLKKLKAKGFCFNNKKKVEELRLYLYNYFYSKLKGNNQTFDLLCSKENFNKFLIRHKIRNVRFRK